MNFKNEYLFCSKRLLRNVHEINEVGKCIKAVKWKDEFSIESNGINYVNQSGYYKAFDIAFSEYKWCLAQGRSHDPARLTGDYSKNNVFVEIQFGESSTVFRDYLKFHNNFTNGLSSLSVLIVPANPKEFFPTKSKNIQGMIEFDFACKYFRLMPVPVPVLLIGLLPGD